MGTWGTAISSNDTFADIYSDFFDLYNDGLDVSEISNILIADNHEIINETDECNNFWFALAKAQWECTQLDNELFTRVKEIIETGADLEVWRNLEADEKDIIKRKAVLDKFLTALQIERPKAKSRKKKIIRQPVFEKGDCLTFKLSNGNYGGAVVLEGIKDSEYGHNLIAVTRINQPQKPTKNDFENSEILIMNHGNWDNLAAIYWISKRHRNVQHVIEKVDKIDVLLEFDINQLTFGHVGDFDIWIIGMADEQFISEKTKPGPSIKQQIKELIRN